MSTRLNAIAGHGGGQATWDHDPGQRLLGDCRRPRGRRVVFGRISAALLASLILLSMGCARTAELQFVDGPGVSDLEPEEQQDIRQTLAKWSGTPRQMKMLGESASDAGDLIRGAQVYQRNCVQCHGVSGDGNGQAAEYLTPRPRDYRRGIFKFTSTPYGNKPRREDLLRTITRGIPGTSMPSFRRMPKHELDAVVDYVLALTHRGELEGRLVGLVQNGDELDDENVKAAVDSIREQWAASGDQVVEPATKMPAFTPESIAAGAEVFQKRECFKCHGRDGRGGLAGGIEVGKDVWGYTDPAADLTSGMLHGGQRPLDVYRRIYSGINGSPMPAFKDALASEPETVWHLAHYVLHLADERRRGKQFTPGAPPNAAAAPEAEPKSNAGASESAPSSGEPAP